MRKKTNFILLLLVFTASCAGPADMPSNPAQDVVIENFQSVYSDGLAPSFELSAAGANFSGEPGPVRLRDTTLTIFTAGRPVSRVTGQKGYFDPEQKRIELYDGVTYHHKEYEIDLRAQRMVWNDLQRVLICETGVAGTIRNRFIKGQKLEAFYDRSEIRISQAAFEFNG